MNGLGVGVLVEKVIKDDTKVWVCLTGQKVMTFPERLEDIWRENCESGFRYVEFDASGVSKRRYLIDSWAYSPKDESGQEIEILTQMPVGVN